MPLTNNPTIAIVVASLLWSSAGIICQHLHISSLLLTESRLAIAGITLFLMLDTKSTKLMLIRMNPHLVIAAILGMAIFQYSFFIAVRIAGASFATWGAIASSPLWATKIRRIGQTFLPYQLIQIFMVTFSLLLMMSALNVSIIGLFSTLISGMSYAIYANAASQSASQSSLESTFKFSLTMTTIALLGGALSLLPLSLVEIHDHEVSNWSYPDSLWILTLGLGSTALPYRLFAFGITEMPVKQALRLQWIQPVATELICYSISNNFPNSMLILSMTILLISLVLSSRS